MNNNKLNDRTIRKRRNDEKVKKETVMSRKSDNYVEFGACIVDNVFVLQISCFLQFIFEESIVEPEFRFEPTAPSTPLTANDYVCIVKVDKSSRFILIR